MVNFAVWVIIGALIGWLASIVTATNAQQGLLPNTVVGIRKHPGVWGRHDQTKQL